MACPVALKQSKDFGILARTRPIGLCVAGSGFRAVGHVWQLASGMSFSSNSELGMCALCKLRSLKSLNTPRQILLVPGCPGLHHGFVGHPFEAACRTSSASAALGLGWGMGFEIRSSFSPKVKGLSVVRPWFSEAAFRYPKYSSLPCPNCSRQSGLRSKSPNRQALGKAELPARFGVTAPFSALI